MRVWWAFIALIAFEFLGNCQCVLPRVLSLLLDIHTCHLGGTPHTLATGQDFVPPLVFGGLYARLCVSGGLLLLPVPAECLACLLASDSSFHHA